MRKGSVKNPERKKEEKRGPRKPRVTAEQLGVRASRKAKKKTLRIIQGGILGLVEGEENSE